MISEKSRVNQQHSELFTEFEQWRDIFTDVRDFINPYLGFFEDETPNSGTRKDDRLLRTISIEYAGILAAGLQNGITSPARPWLQYTLGDYTLAQRDDVRTWLEIRRDIILNVLARSNFYPSNHQFYLELGIFATAAMLIEEDDESVINCRTFTCGEFAIGVDKKGRPNQFARNIQMTPFQIVEQFGYDNVPTNIQRLFDDGKFTKFFKVMHLICPNKSYVKGKIDIESMKFTDYYWMPEQSENEYLKKGGFNEFPVMVERWQVRGADVYGTGPGIWSLGDAKQIQLMWRDICTAAELGVKPPTVAPMDMLKNGGINLLPAGANYYNPMSGSDPGIKPVFQVALNLDHATAVQEAIEDCIKKHFKVDVFQLISQINEGKGERTAREIIELTAEKLSQMGPLLDRLETGYLPQIIDRVDAICERMGLIPPPPEDIEGMEIKVEYVSILSQAQKQALISPILDTANTIIGMATATQQPEILDKLNFDEVSDYLGDYNGVPKAIINSDDAVAQVRQARAQQQQIMDMAAMAQQGANIAKTASDAKLDENSALTQLLGGPASNATMQ